MEEQKGKISVPVNIRGLEEMPRVHNHVAEFVTSLCKYVPRCKERTTLFENWLHQQRNQTPYSADTRNMTNSPQYSANIAPIISCLHVSITRVCIPVARARTAC